MAHLHGTHRCSLNCHPVVPRMVALCCWRPKKWVVKVSVRCHQKPGSREDRGRQGWWSISLFEERLSTPESSKSRGSPKMDKNGGLVGRWFFGFQGWVIFRWTSCSFSSGVEVTANLPSSRKGKMTYLGRSWSLFQWSDMGKMAENKWVTVQFFRSPFGSRIFGPFHDWSLRSFHWLLSAEDASPGKCCGKLRFGREGGKGLAPLDRPFRRLDNSQSISVTLAELSSDGADYVSMEGYGFFRRNLVPTTRNGTVTKVHDIPPWEPLGLSSTLQT